MSRYHVPGIAIGSLHDGDEDIAAYGVTNLEHPLPVDADTLFQIASITKTMTATVVMRLVERRGSHLEAPIRRYLPEFKLRDEATAERATLRHLVTHTGGWLGDCFADFGKGDDALARYVAAMAELEQLTPLGQIWHYSNSSFEVLGRLIEGVAWFLREVGGVTLQYHGGSAIGQQGVLMLAPERGFAIAVQTNSTRGALLHQAITKWALKTFVGVDDPAPQHVRMTRTRRDELVARYTAVGSDIELRAGGDGVLLYRSIYHNLLGITPAPTDPPP